MPAQTAFLQDEIELNQDKIIGPPSKVLGKFLNNSFIQLFQFDLNVNFVQFTACSNYGDRISYWCEWASNDEKIRKIIPSKQARVLCPSLIVSYLETKFDFLSGQPLRFEREFMGKWRKMLIVLTFFSNPFFLQLHVAW